LSSRRTFGPRHTGRCSTLPRARSAPFLAQGAELPSAAARPKPSVAFVRWAGLGLTAGAAAFATTFFVYGVAETEIASRIRDLGGLALQLGLFGLLTVMLRTAATGTSRVARAMIRFEFGLLSLATFWSVAHALVPDEMRGAT